MVEYRHTPDMGEISGFGDKGEGGAQYEECCQQMLNAGVMWLEQNRDKTISGKTLTGVFGSFSPTSDGAKELQAAIINAADDFGGATLVNTQEIMQRLIYIKANGWENYCIEASRQ